MSRILTSIALFAVAIYAIFFAPVQIFIATALVMAALCYHEYTGLAAAHGVTGHLWLGHLVGLALFAHPDTFRVSVVVVLALAMRLRETGKILLFSAAVMLGAIYVYGGWRSLLELRLIGSAWVLFSLAVNWVGDIAAYYVGRAIGRHKLAPRISPGKSWEGAIASLLGAMAFGVAMQSQGMLDVSVPEIVLLSILANIAGQLGDLAESAIKRGASMKDSGTLLPGHGGFLDRLDSSLFTMPVVLYGRYLIDLIRSL